MAKRTDHRRVIRRSPVDGTPEASSPDQPSGPGTTPVTPVGGADPRWDGADSARWDGGDNDRRLEEEVPPHW